MPKREPKRDLVRRSAAQVFLEKGFRDATIQDIADRLEMPKGSAYYHMGSKEELFFEILQSGMTELIERLDTIAGYPLSVLDRLRLAIRDNLRSAVEEIHVPVVLRLVQDVEFLIPEHRTEYLALRDRYERRFIELLNEGMAAGEIRALPNPKILGFSLLGMLSQFSLWYRPEGKLSINEVADLYWEFIRTGLTGQPPAEPPRPAK
jgi:TetR/AcrR family transcriptional regulator, cholesterol catabolism regulator